MVYRYDYGSLIKTNPQANNNFKPLSEVKGTTDYTNFATSLLEAKITTEAKSSDEPELNFEIVFAVAGATKIKSAHLDKEIRSISDSFSTLNSSS